MAVEIAIAIKHCELAIEEYARFRGCFKQPSKVRSFAPFNLITQDPIFNTIAYNFMFSFIIKWCNFFGSHHNEAHWKNYLPQEEHERFRRKLYKTFNGGKDDFNIYRERLKAIRDRIVCHLTETDSLGLESIDTGARLVERLYDELCSIAEQPPKDLSQLLESVTIETHDFMRAKF